MASPIRSTGDVYFRVARFPEYGSLSGQRPDQVEEQEPNALKEDPRDFALWKATKEGEDTSWPSPWGQGRPGWHIECSVMAEQTLGEEFEIHGGGLDLVFPHHENELAQSRALGHPFAHIWAHNGMLRFTGEKMSKSVGNIASIREVLDEYGRETVLVFFLGGHWRKPIDFSRRHDGAGRGAGRGLPQRLPGARASPAATGSAFAAALDDDFNTPEALALMHEWRDHELLRRALAVFGLDSLAETGRGAPPRSSSSRSGGSPPALRGTSTSADALRARDRGRRLGDARRAGRVHPRPEAVSPDLVYGRRAVREALRGRREVLELLATERAVAAEPWLAEARPKVRAERELTRARRHPRPPGRGRARRAVPLRRRLRARRRRAAAARGARPVTDPRNLGAVCRSAEGAGATGVVVPAHGSAVVTPAVARASAGAIEHLPIAVVTNLARYLEEVKGPELWVYGAAGDAEADDVGHRSLRRRRARLRRRGKGTAAARPAQLRRARLDPVDRRRSSR